MRQQPNYGIDSPAIIATELILSLIAFGAAAGLPHLLGLPARWICLIIGLYFLVGALGMVYYSKVGKLKLRDRLLDSIPWRGDERALDIGCGRGLLLIGAAQRLISGKAIGVDVWVRGALSGNRPEAVLQNALCAGISERVDIREGDARQLPFDDASFDVVMSNFVLHELKTSLEREKMALEIVRVLKPGGRLALIDFIFTRECTEVLRKNGVSDARRSRIGVVSFWLQAILTLGANQLHQVTGQKDSMTSTTGQPR
jgi:SAM-dependent methyltransferase